MLAVHPCEFGVADHLADPEDELERVVKAWERSSFLAEVLKLAPAWDAN